MPVRIHHKPAEKAPAAQGAVQDKAGKPIALGSKVRAEAKHIITGRLEGTVVKIERDAIGQPFVWVQEGKAKRPVYPRDLTVIEG